MIPEITDVCYDFDVPKAILDLQNTQDRFLDNILIYISGFIMRSLVSKEKCLLCYAYLTECKQRVTCELINVKQLGGLVYPTIDVLSVVQISNRFLIAKLIIFKHISF